MLVLDHPHPSRPETGPWFSGDPLAYAGPAAPDGDPHDRAAWESALEDGLMDEEIRQVLAGRRMVDAFPVRFREPPQAYAARAVAEMMVVYLS
jgi:hypothetical protein